METVLIIALIQIAAQYGAPFVANLIQLIQNQGNVDAVKEITPEQIQLLKSNLKDADAYFK